MARKRDSTSDIFEWNKRKILSNLLAMEEHLNELSEEDILYFSLKIRIS